MVNRQLFGHLPNLFVVLLLFTPFLTILKGWVKLSPWHELTTIDIDL